jgi:NAD(P)-dependent dehydrogenase (short-subunit alcohol dehydrogenase family)
MLGGRVGIVTGGADGLGEAAVRRLADEGASVVIADVNAQRGAEVESDLKDAKGTVRFIRTDVTSEGDVANLVRQTVSEFGRLDFAINNAGYGHGTIPFLEIGRDTFEEQIAVNLRGTFLCMHSEIEQMLPNGGTIVNVASTAGLKGLPGTSAYAAAKAGIIAMSRTAAVDYVRAGIRVNVVAPGAFFTARMKSRSPEAIKHWEELMPCGRFGDPRELANAMVWLVSDESSYVSGVVLPVDYAASVV